MSNCVCQNNATLTSVAWQACVAQRRRQAANRPPHAHAAARREHATRRALTLIEVVVSTMIVGLMTVAALNGLGAAIRSGESAKNRSIALELADDLMSEILSKPYRDIDGYHGWNQRPPLAPNFDDEDDNHLYREAGDDEYGRFAKFRQRIIIENISPSDPSKVVNGVDQGAKRICVTIEYDDVPLARRYAVVTDL